MLQKPPPRLLSDDWKGLNKELHDRVPEYGVTFDYLIAKVARVMEVHGLKSALDYGCGKGELAKRLQGLDVRSYDPALPEFAEQPQPAELLVSIAMLEHVELEFVEPVLQHMASLTEKVCFITVNCVPSFYRLKNGLNAHATIKKREWWVKKLIKYWDFAVIREDRRGVMFTGRKKA